MLRETLHLLRLAPTTTAAPCATFLSTHLMQMSSSQRLQRSKGSLTFVDRVWHMSQIHAVLYVSPAGNPSAAAKCSLTSAVPTSR